MALVNRVTCSFIVLVAFITYYVILPSYGFDISPAPVDLTKEMNAIVYESHGGSEVIQYKKIHRPLPTDKYVQIKVYAASLNPCDYKMRRNYVPSLLIPLPKIPGGDITGVVEYAPPGSQFKVGDRVVAMVPLVGTKWGGYAEYYASRENFIARVPDNISFEQAASLPLVALTTLQALEDIQDPQSKSILIHAGSGGVGTFAIQWAKKVLKMKSVATTCGERNIQLVQTLGADVVIDYRKEKFTDHIKNYDVVFDQLSYENEKITLNSDTLSKNGAYVNIASSHFQLNSNGVEVANDLWSFINPYYFRLKKLFTSDSITYKTVLVQPNGEMLSKVMEQVQLYIYIFS
jgi:alcohol dehydrogenase